MLEYQVYLKNNEALITKTFHSVSNPRAKGYGNHQEACPVNEANIKRAKHYFSEWEGSNLSPTIFRDVYILKTDAKIPTRRHLPKFIKSIRNDPHFNEAVEIYKKARTKKNVQVLPKLPKIKSALKFRFNLEMMLEGIKGRSMIASNNSVWAEMPAVTVVAESPKTVFSSTFSRKDHAPYQNYFVNVYLWDHSIRTPLKEVDFSRFGRASPDLTIKKIDDFAELVKTLNSARQKKGERPLGFLNHFLYQNPQAFRRKKIKEAEYPNSPTFWSANIGLGRLDFEHLEKCANRLLEPPLPLWKWAFVNFLSLIGVKKKT